MNKKMVVALFTLLMAAGCFANNARQNDAIQEPSESTSQPAEPATTEPESEATPKNPLAVEYDAKFESESRDSAWAGPIESLVNGHMVGGKANVISQLVCKSTICRGVYSFNSIKEKRDAWGDVVNSLDVDPPVGTLRVPISKLEDTYYIYKVSPNAKRID